MKIWMITGGDEEGIQHYELCLTESRADKELADLEAKKIKKNLRIWYHKEEVEVLE